MLLNHKNKVNCTLNISLLVSESVDDTLIREKAELLEIIKMKVPFYIYLPFMHFKIEG